MKTQLQILTALVLTIQVMVNGQTQGNQVTNNRNIDVTHKKTYAVLGATNNKQQNNSATSANAQSSQAVINHQAVKNNLVVTGSISAYNKSLTIKGTAADAKNLLAQTEEMLAIEKQLREQAKTKKGEERTKLINSANELSKQIELVNIQASEITGKVNMETFEFNKDIYLALLNDPNVNDNYVEHSKEINSEAEQTIKLAKEMRQEAYAMPTNAAKLGTMLNAEEKENEALTKQKQAVSLLNKVSSVTFATK